MAVVSSDLVFYASDAVPDVDTGTSGGAIDTLRRLDFTQMSANDTIQALSSSAGDTTQTVTIEGRNAVGGIVTETKTLTGVTPIMFSTLGVVERILKVELSATCAGSVTVRRSTGAVTVRVIPAGERGFMAAFRKTVSSPTVETVYYVKGFWKNTHATLSALSATVKQSADPSGVVTHALDATVNASTSTTNRKTAPALTFNDTDKVVPGTDLAAGSRIGVWFKLTVAAASAPFKSSYTSEIAFQSV